MFSFREIDRLKSKRDFQSVFSKAKKASNCNFSALYNANQLNRARLGIIIAKRLVKSAVDRNQFKRIVRESFRHHQPLLMGLDIIIIMRSTHDLLPYQPLKKIALRRNIDNLWNQLLLSRQAVLECS